MTWQDALEMVVGQTGHIAYRRLCSDANRLEPPNHRDAYRALMVRKASGEPMMPVREPTEAASPHVGCCGQILPT